MRPSTAITGWAWRTPLGDEVDAVVGRMLAGERAAQPNPLFDARTYPCRLAASIPGAPRPSKHRKFVKRMGLWGMEVAGEALARSGARGAGERLGLFCGYGGLRAHWDDLMPVLADQEGDGSAIDAWDRGFKRLHPFWMLSHLSNNAHALLSIDIAAKGDGITTGGANAGAQALEAAIAALAAGSIDTALVFAYDSLVEPETILSLGASGAATSAALEALAAPYDERAAGIVPGEAAAAVVLERAADAGDQALALVEARACADGEGDWPDASTLAAAVADMAEGIAVIDGAALASPDRDAAERAALSEVLGARAILLATSASTGALGGAGPIVQAIALASFLRRGMLPPIAGLSRPSPGPLLPLARAEGTAARKALGISAGMPGLGGALRVEIP
jgi:3-oxoacyl-(acyl-carrier-protein) synthase